MYREKTEKGEVLEIKTVSSAQKCLGEIFDTVRRKYLFLLSCLIKRGCVAES